MPVTFEAKGHTYKNQVGVQYTSVTTLIKKYTPPFDTDFWSTYKALQAVLEEKGEWVSYKREAGGWENVVMYARLDANFAYRKEVIQKKKEILKEWELNRDESAKLGSEFHDMKEKMVKTSTIYNDKMEEVQVASKFDLITNPVFDGSTVYPELMIYNDKFKIAGQADWVYRVGDVINIKDYKTSKNVDKKAFQEQTFLHPLGHIPNANYFKFSLQMSIYAYLLEMVGYKIGKLSIEHVDKKTFKTIEMYPCKYHREEVKELIKHYCEETDHSI